ncbi:hypothetical protein BDR22DRAFT_98072 [Usnea florida]
MHSLKFFSIVGSKFLVHFTLAFSIRFTLAGASIIKEFIPNLQVPSKDARLYSANVTYYYLTLDLLLPLPSFPPPPHPLHPPFPTPDFSTIVLHIESSDFPSRCRIAFGIHLRQPDLSYLLLIILL